MCIRNGGAAADEDEDSVIKQPIRRTRSKTRRPKFVSLRLELIGPENSQSSSLGMSPMQLVNGGRHQLQQPPPPQQQQQLNLFPLHPENLMEVEDRECMHDENVAFIFNDDVGSTACCSLQSFLPNYQTAISVSSEEDSLNFGYSEVGHASSLVRTAMRSRERDAREEEKWVCYSEVVEKKEPASSSSDHQVEELEVTSSAADDDWIKKKKNKKNKKKKVEIRKQLSLKLDYQGILNAWSDKAPLFIKGESPQTVPSLHDDQSLCHNSFANRVMEGVGSEGNAWKVPEMEGWKVAQREASVLRYKEKRQSRLFSKRIRYQVRKLNAEKRPRMKGRFVKRS